jgi:hypothetical protein
MLKKIILFLLIPTVLNAFEPFHDWDAWDKGLYAASLTASAADMYTTHRAIQNGAYERNPFLPEHPSPQRLATHWLLCAAGKYIIADLLPGQWRKPFLVGCASIDLHCARINLSLFF